MDLGGWDLRLWGRAGRRATIASPGLRSGGDTGVVMEVLTLCFGTRLRCLASRNPLVRVADRFEAAAGILLVTVALLAAPIAGAVGTATHDALARQYAADRASRHSVVATVTGDSVLAPREYEQPFLTAIRWDHSDEARTGAMRTHRMKAGDTMTIWVDTSGNPTTPPLTDENAATEAVVTGFGLWFTTVGIIAAAWTLLRLRLNRFRYAAWDRELKNLADNGGRTNHSA